MTSTGPGDPVPFVGKQFPTYFRIAKDPKTSHIPVILVTTKGQETDKIWGMRQGAKAYVTKPIDEKELTQAIATLLPKV